MLRFLERVGGQARWLLALGCLAALFLPALSALVRPALPALVMLVLGVAMARIDLPDVLRGVIRPRFVLRQGLLVIALMPVTGAVYVALGSALGIERAWLVYLAAAPPIASAGGLCLLMGYNARLAVEASVFGALASPVLGPLTVWLLLPGGATLEPGALAMRLGAMIAGALVLAFAIRRVVGPERIVAHKRAFDGVAAMAMVLFVLPLFDGVGATMLARPGLALWALAVGFAFNMGVTVLVRRAARGLGMATAGTLGVIWGNRTIAMYLAVLPPDPVFTLFVALYQFPMYLTPLMLGRRQA